MRALLIAVALLMVFACVPQRAFADSSIVEVIGWVYEFDKNGNYEISDSSNYVPSRHDNTYGTCSVQAKIADITEQDGIMSIGVKSRSVGLCYSYGNEGLYVTDEYGTWALADDNGKTVDGMKLDKIGKGAIIVQSSWDGWDWQTEFTETDNFEKTPYRADPVFYADAEQFGGGCYYRIIVAYKEQNLTDEKQVLWFDIKDYDYRKKAEVYEFYLYDAGIEEEPQENTTTEKSTEYLGSTLKADGPGYVGENGIDEKDPHYGWELGQFSISGFSASSDEDGTPVFIRNEGDQVTLSFRLLQDIDKLNGKDSLRIEADRKGTDTYFGIGETDFGRGALIVRKGDGEPAIYSEFLEANARKDTDMQILTLEEGDYEIALNYKVKEEKSSAGFFFIRPTTTTNEYYYTIFFHFSVRSGACEIVPLETGTNRELQNRSFTETGFTLDLTKSRYLNVNVKRVMITKDEDGWSSDILFDGPAQEGAVYSEEGFYTITAKNSYTGEEAMTKIYVGTDAFIKAHVVTGRTIDDIEELVASGATINDDGTLDLSGIEVMKQAKARKRTTAIVLAIVAAVVLAAAAVVVYFIGNKKKRSAEEEEPDDDFQVDDLSEEDLEDAESVENPDAEPIEESAEKEPEEAPEDVSSTEEKEPKEEEKPKEEKENE